MNCQSCWIGHYKSTHLPYLYWIDDQFIVIPHVPAHKCDVCGKTNFDINFLHKLQFLLDQLASDAPIKITAAHHLMPDDSLTGNYPEGVDSLVC